VTLFRTLMVIAAVGTVLAAGYLLWLYQRTAFGEPSAEFSGHAPHPVGAGVNEDHHAEIHDVTPLEWVAWTPFLVAIVVFGVYPQLMFGVMDPAVSELVARLGESLNP
jgi:NADH-quinone oxidoreductase subunit M